MSAESRSQSEVIGVVLLIGVVVTLVFLVGGVALNIFLLSSDTPQVDIDAEATTQNVTVTHAEGDSLNRDDIEIILEGDVRERYSLTEFTQIRGSDNTSFERGDKWYSAHGINTDRMTVLAIHQPTNTVLDRETVDVVETLAVRFSTNATASTTANDTIEFDAAESTDPDGTIANYTWTFDDGTTGETTNSVVTHSYESSGTYDVTLRINTSDGRTRTLIKTITVFPTANFTVSPSNPFEGENVTFDASNSGAGTGAIAEYEWDFGDGTTNTTASASVERNYTSAGSYFVSLTVRDSDGVEATDSATVQVRNEVANLQLDLTPDAAGADAVHNWSFDDVDFAGNQNDDEVDTITVDYSGTGASFDGLDDGNITVVFTRALADSVSTDEVSVNSDTYSSESATFDLSGVDETSIVGAGYVKIDGLTNPPVGQDYQAEITFSGADTVSDNATFDTTTPAKQLTLTPDNSTVTPGQPNDITVDVADQAGNSLDEEVNVTVASGNGTFENGNQNVTVQTGANGQTTVNYTAAASDKNTEIQLDGKLTSNTSVTDSATFNVSGGPGVFRGAIEDGDGNALTQTDVTFSAEDGSFTRTVQTNGTGQYNVTNVPEGTYNITASATGYQSATNNSVTIVEGETTTGVNYTLENTVENLTLDVAPTTPGDDALHNWSFDNVDFGDNENDQVETITLNYSGTGASFEGLTDENVTVVLTRNLSSGPDTSEISVNSATYSGDSITIDLSGRFETSIVGAGYVSVEDVTNPPGAGTYNASINFDGPSDTASATQSFTVTEPGFVRTSVTDIVPAANEQDQLVQFTLDGGLDQGESVTVNLTEPQNGSVDYLNASSAAVVNTVETTGDATLSQNNGVTTITYAPQETDGDDHRTEVRIRLRGVEVNDSTDTYSVGFERTDNNALTRTTTFETARGSGQPNLAVDIANVTASDNSHNVTLTPQTEQFNDSERVAIELADPHASDSATPPKVQYRNASVVGNGNGQVVSFSQVDNNETAYVIYEAPGQNAASLNNVTLSLDVENAEAGTESTSFEVGVSRATADTTGANFSLATPASFNVTDIAPDLTRTGITESVSVTVTNEGGVAGNQTIEYDLEAYSVAVIDQGETHGADIATTLETELSGHQGEYTVDTLTAAEALDSVDEYNTVVVQRLGDQYADQLISAIETNDTTAVYLGQWRDINDQYTEPDSSYSDGFARLAQYRNTNYVRSQEDTPLSSPEPVVIDVERNHPLFDGVTTAGNAFPVHNQDWSDRVWLTNYEGTTYGTIRHESESTGTGGPAVLVGEDEILLGMGRSNFVPNSAYTAEANMVLGNAVANMSQQATVQTAPLSLAAGETGTVTFQVEMPAQAGTYDHRASSENDTLVKSIDVSKTSFTGQITDGTGDPVANTEVRISGDGLNETVTTDANGVYTVENITAGTYELVANAEGYEESTQVTANFVRGSTTENVDFVLPDVTVWGSGQLEGFFVQNLDATVTVSTADGSTVEFIFDIDWFFGYITQEITIDGVTYTLTDDAVERAGDGSFIDLLDPENYQGLDSADEQRIREIRERITEEADVSTITENEGSVEIEISEENPN